MGRSVAPSAVTAILATLFILQPPPPLVYDSETIQTGHAIAKFPIATAGQACEAGTALGVPIAADVDLPAWGQDLSQFYPFSACLPDAGWLLRMATHSPEGLLTIPVASTSPLESTGVCVGLPGLTIPGGSSLPLPVSLAPVAASAGDVPVPCRHLTAHAGRNAAYFGGERFHTGSDFVGGCTLNTPNGVLPRNAVLAIAPCEPVCVRAGLVVCATPMPIGWTGSIPDPRTWGMYWQGDGLTLLTTYLHVNTCGVGGGIIATWEATAPTVKPGKTFAETNPLIIPPARAALTTYCAAPTEATCGTTAPHLHLQIAVITNAAMREVLQATGTARVQPQSGCADGNRYTCPALWWAGLTKGMVSAYPLYAPAGTVSIDPNLASCFGATGGSESLSSIVAKLRAASPGQIPTPHEIMTNHQATLRQFIAWYNSQVVSTSFGPATPVVRVTCPSGGGFVLAHDIGYPGTYPGPERGYSGNCRPAYPPIPSLRCPEFDYIPGHSTEAGLQWAEYQEAAARALFFAAWYSVYSQ